MSLIVVCTHCLTWIEPHADRCTECGVIVDVDAPDLDDETLAARLGEPLAELGPVRLERRGWPSLGRLITTSEGILFLPDHDQRQNGALEPRRDEPIRRATWFDQLTQWWQSARQPAVTAMPFAWRTSDQRSVFTASQWLFEAPGGLFVRRSSVRRTLARWNHLKIERQPLRSVVLAPAAPGDTVRQLLSRLHEQAAWPL